MKKLSLTVVLLAFAALNAYAVVVGGLDGLLAQLRSTDPWHLVFATDLVISLTLVAAWLVGDARRRGRSALPFVALTVASGSIGPLLYLVTRPEADAAQSDAQSPRYPARAAT